MALDDDIRILSAVKLFEGFTADQLRLLAFGAEHLHVAPEKRLYREDDEADCAYVVVRGTIVLFREGEGRRVPVGTAARGAILSEMALIAETRRLTSASAAAPADLLRLNRRMFRRILEEYPETAMMLHRKILADFQALVRRIEALAPRFAE